MKSVKCHLIMVLICTAVVTNVSERVFTGNKDQKIMGIELLLNIKSIKILDFPGSPVAKTPRFQCRGHGFDPWSGN